MIPLLPPSAPDVAAGGLLAAAAEGGSTERLLAISIVNGLGMAAEPAWRDELPEQIRDAVPPGQEQQIFDAMSRSPHPDAASVLSLIGRRHPDKPIAKAARTSAHRAASRPKRARSQRPLS